MDLLGLLGLIVLSMGAFALGYMLPDLFWWTRGSGRLTG